MTSLATLCLILLMLALPRTVSAQDTIAFALFSRGWEPYEIVNERGGPGIAVDLFRAVMPEDVSTTVDPGNKPRARFNLGGDPIQYTRLEAPEWMQGKPGLLWSAPVMAQEDVLISPAGSPLEYTGIAGLHGKQIGCIRNYRYPSIEPLFSKGDAYRYDVNKDILLLRMVKAGRVDCAVLDRRTTYWMIRNNDDLTAADFHIAATPVDSVDLHFVFKPGLGWEAKLPLVNDRIRQIREDGTLERILHKYQ